MMSILYTFLMLFVLYIIVKYGVKILFVLVMWGVRLTIFGLIVVFVYKLYERSCC